MEFVTAILLLLLLLLLLLSLLIIYFDIYQTKTKFPPGPWPLPIIGNILQLGLNPHRSAAKLSKTYGPLMYLKLGSMQTIVVSSPEMAKQVLQKHDQLCSSRVAPCAIQVMGLAEASVAWLDPGPKWRTFRKICKEEIFASSKLEATKTLRHQKLQQMRHYLEECSSTTTLVEFEELAFITTLNLLSTTFFSIDFARFGSGSVHEMTAIVKEIAKVMGTPNIADLFPFLKHIDPQGLNRRVKFHFDKLYSKLDQQLRQRLESPVDSSTNKDLLQILIDLHQQDGSVLSTHEILMLLLDIIIAGTTTTTDTVEWTMTELLRNPEKMEKAKSELKSVIGENKQVEEEDISRLPYLRAVIKEVLRSHPPAPFLAPHKADDDVEINGYMIPKGARIFVNVWAIGRDTSKWLNPDSFEPERFLDHKIDYKGQDFEFLPFGSGRRMCPGIPLAHLMLHLMVGTMIHNFDWKLEEGMKPEDIDLNDVMGISLHKKVPLKAFPVIIQK